LRKYPYTPKEKLTKTLRGREVSDAQLFKEKYDAKMEFSEG